MTHKAHQLTFKKRKLFDWFLPGITSLCLRQTTNDTVNNTLYMYSWDILVDVMVSDSLNMYYEKQFTRKCTIKIKLSHEIKFLTKDRKILFIHQNFLYTFLAYFSTGKFVLIPIQCSLLVDNLSISSCNYFIHLRSRLISTLIDFSNWCLSNT